MTLTRPENLEAFQALRDYYQTYAAAGPNKGIDAWSGFQNGQNAMDWIGAWKMDTYLMAKQSGGMKFAWGIAPVPLNKNRANTRWDDPLYISSTTPHVEAAWEFVKDATGDEGQALWAQMTGKIPARASAVGAYVQKVHDASGMSNDEVITAVSGALNNGRTSLEESIAYVPAWIDSLTGEWIDPMLAGKKPVKDALESLQQILDGKPVWPRANECRRLAGRRKCGASTRGAVPAVRAVLPLLSTAPGPGAGHHQWAGALLLSPSRRVQP